MRRNITSETWHQIKTVYASGIGLREIPRKMGIPPGTILSRVPGGIRTPNLLIRSQKLYPVELQAQLCKSQIPTSKSQRPRWRVWSFGFGICEGGWPTGLEPATTRTTIWGSTIELRPPLLPQKQDFKI
jgi:hypothetical protein